MDSTIIDSSINLHVIFTFRDNMTAGMDMMRVIGEKIPHKMAAKRDRVK